MARLNQSDERRKALLPVLAQVFGQTGYRRTKTAQLAEACQLQETQLYRIWPSKKAMFLDVLDHLFENEKTVWEKTLGAEDAQLAVQKILSEEGKVRGDSGLHRIIFAALSESDDTEIHASIQQMYRQYHAFITELIGRCAGPEKSTFDHGLAAWAMIGLGTVVNIGREFDLFTRQTQSHLMDEIGGALMRGGE